MHDRIKRMDQFYREGSGVCSFMSPEMTRFSLVPNRYTDEIIGVPLLAWVKTKQPMALTYVWENDPANIEKEREVATTMFGDLLRILVEDETGSRIDRQALEQELREVFAPDSIVHPHLGYKREGFYNIIMGPRHTSRYAPCFSMVLTRITDVQTVHAETALRIRRESEKRMGETYDANALFINPHKRK